MRNRIFLLVPKKICEKSCDEFKIKIFPLTYMTTGTKMWGMYTDIKLTTLLCESLQEGILKIFVMTW
jgi:hypothetical protein